MSEPLALYAFLGSWFLVAVIRMWEKIRESTLLKKVTKDHVIAEIAGVVGCCLFVPELVIFTIGLIGFGSMLATLVECWRLLVRKGQ
jgi:hypothetical protein